MLDTAGQEEFSAMQDGWMREGETFILVYRINNKTTFDQCKVLREKILRVKDPNDDEKVPMVLTGAMCDLEDERRIEYEEGKQLAKEWGCPFIECSAKQNLNIEETFNIAARELLGTHNGDNAEAGSNDRDSTKYKEYVLKFCTILIYICLLGCIWHGLYLLIKKLYDYGCCDCTRCIQLCESWKCQKDDNDDNEQYDDADDIEAREKRNQLKLLFKKVDYIEEDMVREPILSLKNFKIGRKFHFGRFIKALLCGLFLPIVIVFQTFVFLTYREGKELFFYQCFYPFIYPYDKIHYGLLLDFLGLIVGRRPKQDPDAVKDRNWFLRQSQLQKLQRVAITMLLCLTFLIVFYNIYEVRNEKLRVSLMESAGPFVLFWIVWLLLSCWIAYEPKLKPNMPDTFRLRYVYIIIGVFTNKLSVLYVNTN